MTRPSVGMLMMLAVLLLVVPPMLFYTVGISQTIVGVCSMAAVVVMFVALYLMLDESITRRA